MCFHNGKPLNAHAGRHVQSTRPRTHTHTHLSLIATILQAGLHAEISQIRDLGTQSRRARDYCRVRDCVALQDDTLLATPRCFTLIMSFSQLSIQLIFYEKKRSKRFPIRLISQSDNHTRTNSRTYAWMRRERSCAALLIRDRQEQHRSQFHT